MSDFYAGMGTAFFVAVLWAYVGPCAALTALPALVAAWFLWARPVAPYVVPVVPDAAGPTLEKWGLDASEGYAVAWSFFLGLSDADSAQINDLIEHTIESVRKTRE